MKILKSKKGVWFAAAAVPALISGLMPVFLLTLAVIAFFGFGSLFSLNRLFDKVIQNPVQSAILLGGIIVVTRLFKGGK